MYILEMKVPSPGESITEVEIATWLVQDGDYVEKDQPIAEVDSDKATLDLPAEESGIITLKAEEGEVVQVGQVVCLIDMDAKKPEGSAPAAEAPKAENAEAPKAEQKVVEKPAIVCEIYKSVIVPFQPSVQSTESSSLFSKYTFLAETVPPKNSILSSEPLSTAIFSTTVPEPTA